MSGVWLFLAIYNLLVSMISSAGIAVASRLLTTMDRVATSIITMLSIISTCSICAFGYALYMWYTS